MLLPCWSPELKLNCVFVGDAPEENGEAQVEGEVRACDTIQITGREENCQAAKEALLALVPVEVEVSGLLLAKS